MTLHQAKKLIIITEKLISEDICAIIEAHGATGYTLVAAGGKGSRNIRGTSEIASVISDFANVKIESVLQDREMGERIMQEIAEKYFHVYSGIAYMEDVEILRPFKFETRK